MNHFIPTDAAGEWGKISAMILKIIIRLIFRLTGIFSVVIAFLFCSGPARAALECGQLAAVAQTAVKLRDQGESLNAVLSEMERGELQKVLDAKELNLLRQIVRLSYTSEASVHEIFESCQAGAFGTVKPSPKPKT